MQGLALLRALDLPYEPELHPEIGHLEPDLQCVREVHRGGSLLEEMIEEPEHHPDEMRGEGLGLRLTATATVTVTVNVTVIVNVPCSVPDHRFDDPHQLVLVVDFDSVPEVQSEEMIGEMIVYRLDLVLQIGDVVHPPHLQVEHPETHRVDPLHQYIQNAFTLRKPQPEIRDPVHHLSESVPLQPNLLIEREILLGQLLGNARRLVL